MSAEGASAEKTRLRGEMKALRAACKDRPLRDDEICRHFFSVPKIVGADSFFVYNALAGEAATGNILARLLAENKKVYLPRTECKEMFAVRWEGQALQKGAFGIYEPGGEPFFGEIDVCVLPLLAADGQFYRLGYGGGYYDRFLSGKNIFKVGLCYDFQLTGRVPHEPHDIRLDALVTDKRILLRGPKEETWQI